jgi:hypothetical protein
VNDDFGKIEISFVRSNYGNDIIVQLFKYVDLDPSYWADSTGFMDFLINWKFKMQQTLSE